MADQAIADAVWTLDDDGVIDAIGTSVSPGVARAVRTLVAARASASGHKRGHERRSLVLADREAELLELKGPCLDPECRLHYAHRGPHDIVGEHQ